MNVSPFIDDGMQGEFTIPAVEGYWPEVKGRYRPFCAAEESAVLSKSQLVPGTGTAKFYAELCASKIDDWDLKDAAGKKVEPTAANICRLTSEFFEVLRERLRQPVQQPKN